MRSTGAGIVGSRSVLAGLGIVGALLATGCGGDTSSATPTTARSSTAVAGTAAPTATVSAPEGAIDYGPTTFVAGQDACDFADDVHATWTTDPDGTVRVRDGWFTCTVTADDPRAAGTARATWNADRWGEEDHGAMVQWGTIRIENAGGTWVGTYAGIYTSDTGDTVTSLLRGTGDYEGLSFYRWQYKTFGATWPTEGLIFPGAVPSH